MVLPVVNHFVRLLSAYSNAEGGILMGEAEVERFEGVSETETVF